MNYIEEDITQVTFSRTAHSLKILLLRTLKHVPKLSGPWLTNYGCWV